MKFVKVPGAIVFFSTCPRIFGEKKAPPTPPQKFSSEIRRGPKSSKPAALVVEARRGKSVGGGCVVPQGSTISAPKRAEFGPAKRKYKKFHYLGKGVVPSFTP